MKRLLLVAMCMAATACDQPTAHHMKGTENFRRVESYDDVTKYFDYDFNPPKVPEEMSQGDFEAEFDAAHDTIIKHLKTVGSATEDSGEDSDFSLYRYVDVRRAINVVCDKFGPEVVFAIQRAQNELPADYAINLDSHPAYVSILPTGDVLGFSETEEGQKILDQYGFPR